MFYLYLLIDCVCGNLQLMEFLSFTQSAPTDACKTGTKMPKEVSTPLLPTGGSTR